MKFQIEAITNNHNILFNENDWYDSSIDNFDDFCERIYRDIISFAKEYEYDGMLRVEVCIDDNEAFKDYMSIIVETLGKSFKLNVW